MPIGKAQLLQEGTDLTLVSLDAYYRAAETLSEFDPECGLPWWAIAGISRVEGRHGTFGGSELDAEGTADPFVYTAVASGDRPVTYYHFAIVEPRLEALAKAIPMIDRCAQKGIIPKRRASRLVSRLTRAVGGLGEANWAREAGKIRFNSLQLWNPTMSMGNYQMVFQGQIESKAMSWAFRAKDVDNYYAAKLAVPGPGGPPRAEIVRYAMVAGKKIIVEWLSQRGRPFLFSSAMTVPDAAACLAAVEHAGRDVLPGGSGRGAEPGSAGDFQQRSREPVHGHGVYRAATGPWGGHQHGRPRPSDRQRVRRAALVEREVRGGLPEGL